MWAKADFGTTGLVFPGAGIAPSGFEKQFFDHNAAFMGPLMARASEFTGADLAAALDTDWTQSLDPLSTQVFTYAYGLGVRAAVLAHCPAPVLVAGHSLGIYAALASARCVSFEDGLFLVKAAYESATRACAGRNCGMLAIAGLTLAEVDELIEGEGAPSLRRVITNSEMSQVVAGGTEALESFERTAIAAEATRVVWLDREVAYHHPAFLAEASNDFAMSIGSLAFRDPEVPLVSSIDGSILSSAGEAGDFTVRNLSSPIDWQRVLLAFDERGIDTAFECGPGTTLTRMGRFVDADFRYLNVKKIVRRGG